MSCKSNVTMITNIKCVNKSCISKPTCLDGKGIERVSVTAILSRTRTVNIAHAEMKTGVKSYVMNVSERGKGYPIRKEWYLFSALLQWIKELESHQTRGCVQSEHAFMDLTVWGPGCLCITRIWFWNPQQYIHQYPDIRGGYVPGKPWMWGHCFNGR